MCVEQGTEHVLNVKVNARLWREGTAKKKKSLFWNISEWCIILYHRGGTALLLIQSLWKNIYIAVFIRAARRFYASFKKGSWYIDRRAHEVGEEIAFFFLSIPPTPSMMMQRFSSHHIKHSSLWKLFFSRFWVFPSELKYCFCYSLLLKMVASLWVHERKLICVHVCVCCTCVKNCPVAFRARQAAAVSLFWLCFWNVKSSHQFFFVIYFKQRTSINFSVMS